MRFLSILPREAPSVRPRIYAYLPALAEAGVDATVSPFLSSRAFRGFYRGGIAGPWSRWAGSVAGYARRAWELSFEGAPDLAVVHREAVPRGNRWVIDRLRARKVPIAYDLDDAIYLAPRDFVAKGEDSREAMTRGKDPSEVLDLMGAADLVLAGNETLAARAREAGARRIVVQPTPVDTDLFRPAAAAAPDAGPPRVGWIGSPTATYCLRAIAPALAAAARAAPFRLLVVGASGPVDVPGVEVIRRDWSLDREAADYASLAVGLYPLPDNPWTRGKCGYKALLYQSCAVPCLASPVAVSAEIVQDGVTGFHAADDAAWTDRLVALLRDPALRARLGAAGRRAVEERWSLRVLAPKMVSALKEAAAR
ncbi:MAG TPA: glycosyltransferase [Planctomycetota bacterium]|nr:glycosyltransferase [Planctomycetota bacterium]